jgi:hypothetical protein
MGSLTVSLTPSLNPKMTLTKFLRHVVTRRVSVYFFILSSELFLHFIFIFVYILYTEPVYIDNTRSSLKFFVLLSDISILETSIRKKKRPLLVLKGP